MWTALQTISQPTATALQAVATVVAAIIVGVFGAVLGRIFSRFRDRQDRESQWRQHAIELTKLDQERKIKTMPPNTILVLRPAILDFLANYRDLQELGMKTPKELYGTILKCRISERTATADPEAAKGSQAPTEPGSANTAQ